MRYRIPLVCQKPSPAKLWYCHITTRTLSNAPLKPTRIKLPVLLPNPPPPIWVLSHLNLVSTPFYATLPASTGQYLSWTKYSPDSVPPKLADGDSTTTPTGRQIYLPSARSLAEACRLLRDPKSTRL